MGFFGAIYFQGGYLAGNWVSSDIITASGVKSHTCLILEEYYSEIHLCWPCEIDDKGDVKGNCIKGKYTSGENWFESDILNPPRQEFRHYGDNINLGGKKFVKYFIGDRPKPQIELIGSPKATQTDVAQPQPVEKIPPELETIFLQKGYKSPDVLKADLNDDGKDDFLTTYSAVCGSGGCSYDIFVFKQGNYQQIPAPELWGAELTVTQEKKEGFHSITLTTGDHVCGPDSTRILATYEYKGGEYVSARTEKRPFPCK